MALCVDCARCGRSSSKNARIGNTVGMEKCTCLPAADSYRREETSGGYIIVQEVHETNGRSVNHITAVGPRGFMLLHPGHDSRKSRLLRLERKTCTSLLPINTGRRPFDAKPSRQRVPCPPVSRFPPFKLGLEDWKERRKRVRTGSSST